MKAQQILVNMNHSGTNISETLKVYFMLTIASKNLDIDTNRRENLVTYEKARLWIGRRLILRKPLLSYAPGMPCVVMCVVDFGDGPLLWIVSDDNQAVEVVQLELSSVSEYFNQRIAEAPGLII